jgi:hypothetical protein
MAAKEQHRESARPLLLQLLFYIFRHYPDLLDGRLQLVFRHPEFLRPVIQFPVFMYVHALAVSRTTIGKIV